ncbi:uncharacterized protein ACA1_174660 [Acanthamoeba castellanii str. Neff]|uniref:Uncharacterized protein n=1 Tax=Acanthamoeba castellanii (strain ATCC 30010 / Neff) TaxID=1257118 RepID=L8HGW2_ACACF|nr:uncharacterized protein ACA1_174660 [Acanthamoeba castellanii str. Neff]ELR24804.1 hypothetical protein ACA1_174660 [Acanthamoeba castellanii str. Neff]
MSASADPFLRGRVARFEHAGKAFVLVGTHHGLPRASSIAVERVLEAERPDTIVAESTYSRFKLPPYDTRACEFAFTSQWALKHNGNPVHRSIQGLHRPFHEVRWGGIPAEEQSGAYVRPPPAGHANTDVTSSMSMSTSLWSAGARWLLGASVPLYSAAVVPLLRLGDLASRGTHRLLEWDDRNYFLHHHPLEYKVYMSSVEREMFFIKALREAPGTKVVGVFGMLHLAGIMAMWEEYGKAPYRLWQTTEHEGKDVTRALATAYMPAVAAHWQAHIQALQKQNKKM